MEFTAIWKGSHNPRLTITMVGNYLLNGMILQVVVEDEAILSQQQVQFEPIF